MKKGRKSGCCGMGYRDDLKLIYVALQEKGYDPERQIAGFLMTQDPTYITAHNGARKIAGRLDTAEVLADITKFYVKQYIKAVPQATK